MIMDGFDPTVFWDEPRFSRHVFTFFCKQLSKSPLLGGGALLVAGNLELGPVEGLSHMVLGLQLSVDGRDVLATVSWGFPKAPCGYRCLEPRLGIA